MKWEVPKEETSYGYDTKESSELLWFLFLDNSEYFKEAYFEDTNHIITRSELNLQLRIPINAPEKLSVIK